MCIVNSVKFFAPFYVFLLNISHNYAFSFKINVFKYLTNIDANFLKHF